MKINRDELEAELARMHPDAFAWALRCSSGRREEAEDALHAAYFRIIDGKARFDGRSSVRTWLFGVIRRTALQERRRSWLRLTLLQRWFERGSGESGQPSDPGGLVAGETAARLKHALGQLSKRQREILHLVFYQELTVQEAAEVLGMPVGTARTHYERGKTRLRALLAEEGPA
jgi:RNA polymerase sigma-70 factor (ECF subfamily)